MTDQVKSYLEKERARHLDEVMAFVRIPSVSSSTEHKVHMKEAAEWLADSLRRAGLEHVEVMQTNGHPVVYGDWLHAPGKPTALVYGHYDVQPAEPLSEWNTPPFEPVIRDGKLYGRGATDDKAQLYTHIKTVEAFLRTEGRLPVNIKFCLEGEEEIASPNLAPFLEAHAERLAADLIVISDGPMHDEGVPSICCGLRGLCGFQIDIAGPKNDLHSGLYGGGVANPVSALVELLASMKDTDGTITIEGFYDKVRPLTDADREASRPLELDDAKICSELHVPELYGEKGYTFLERTTARPTLEINGIYGGHQGEGLKPIVPSSAGAKVSCRLVDEQDPDEIMALIKRHIDKHQPQGVTVSVQQSHRGKPFFIPPEHPYIQAAAKAYEDGFGKPPVYIRSGGSIPIVEVFYRLLGTPVVMMDFGLPGENMHGPNEHFHLDNFDKGIATLCRYWQELQLLSEQA
ncbi:dipeptidase [Paenibacillus allorhizosphaerae]|uniref:Succinyl-diaminopimelate desuccinylase n=1 Tax=Paenibacillus allorhizosphaerae TaxID=2849866 RepID=A0ABM8VKB1_9BACL|nr:dipeptidase [Paenibacillus allorhizosphaerae]CAG7646469.1 Succinyl-diaminopimelate desuccinylase [Paenibacillus allorhizosphaerae]